jgi:hypothetical protein
MASCGQLTAPAAPVAEENDRSMRNIADKPVRNPAGTQVSDVTERMRTYTSSRFSS